MHKLWLSIALLAAATQVSASAPAARAMSRCHTALVIRWSAYPVLATPAPDAIRWRAPDGAAEGRDTAGWCDGVGPAVVAEGPLLPARADSLVIVSWNMHVGGGRLPALLASLGLDARPERPRPAFVLLLQEAFRADDSVPPLRHGIRSARRIGQRSAGDRDIVQLARDLGLWGVYVPSMRNGGEGVEDRGNAILSSLRLDGIEAIELPDSRQRRVAVAADVLGRGLDGAPWRVRVVSAHLESRTTARRFWIFAGGVRAAQAHAVVRALDGTETAVIGGDFNSWAGFDERAYRETAPYFPDTHVTDRRPTFAFGRRLDHLLFRLRDGWRARFERLDERFGSDHHPLAGVVTLANRSRAAHEGTMTN
jgi:endonuclease/exonuclease/phosphatase family metal-dependent hydrolase